MRLFGKHVIEETPAEKAQKFLKKNQTAIAAVAGTVVGAGAYALTKSISPKMSSADFLKGLRGKGGDADV